MPTRSPTRFRLCFLAAFVTLVPMSPHYLQYLAKQQPQPAEKIALLRQCLQKFPATAYTAEVNADLIQLLVGSHRYREALQVYRGSLGQRRDVITPDLKLLELLVQSGDYAEVERQTASAPRNGQDIEFDERIAEFRIQALLAQGHYRRARQAADQWLGMHQEEGLQTQRYASLVSDFQQVRRYLAILERQHGAQAKPLFTAATPHSLSRWSHRRNMPVVFFKLLPADPSLQSIDPRLAGTKTEIDLHQLIREANNGFRYVSGGAFSVAYGGHYTLFVKKSDLGLTGSRINLLASRLYVHTIAPLYRLAGWKFVVLIDYRARPDEETAYMGDGLMHIMATNLSSQVLLHEILHGLGATHQDWRSLSRLGYLFDSEDRGLMTFEKGKLAYLGLEEKNRVLLDWPKVPAVPLDRPVSN